MKVDQNAGQNVAIEVRIGKWWRLWDPNLYHHDGFLDFATTLENHQNWPKCNKILKPIENIELLYDRYFNFSKNRNIPFSQKDCLSNFGCHDYMKLVTTDDN